MANRLSNAMVNEEALIWAKVKKILKTKGADSAINVLREIRAGQHFRRCAINQLFRQA